ncbi:unnamed protein product [Parajaminaea phylloscopi]
MPPKKSTSSSGGAATRKTTSSIAQSFKPAAKRTTSGAVQSAKQQSLSRSNSLTKITQPALSAAASEKSSRETSPEKRLQDATAKLTKEEVQEADKLPSLDVNDTQWNGIWRATQREKLGKVGAIHADGQNRIHHILRAFDFDPTYGPCLGMTRLERWNRAKNLGEDPPEEVYEILTTKEGKLWDEYRETCLTVMGV